ncbi:hypothetical protein ADL22_17820 [Streptomyces sp. NRRL F-4489]|uniref:hypothetical protein n=1 Tax=Streptomyces sp. NRRL F-4489 TaxID=1609095 RepID=UPI00074A411D|nr:hypothetical protein [Streptomyces sp. NRRL F-4489]KUL38627.1 hypothetical protein ADL22_17820 [Streptomyces sp. NRRL F-4489]
MVNTERGPRWRPPVARRSEGDARRRRALADAAAGVAPGEAATPPGSTPFGRFRCVIYLCRLPAVSLDRLRTECAEYADAFCWEIAAVIVDEAGPLPPEDRPGFRQAVGHISSGAAGAVVTAQRSMVSATTEEYDRVAREIEQAGGFLHVMRAAPREELST